MERGRRKSSRESALGVIPAISTPLSDAGAMLDSHPLGPSRESLRSRSLHRPSQSQLERMLCRQTNGLRVLPSVNRRPTLAGTVPTSKTSTPPSRPIGRGARSAPKQIRRSRSPAVLLQASDHRSSGHPFDCRNRVFQQVHTSRRYYLCISFSLLAVRYCSF